MHHKSTYQTKEQQKDNDLSEVCYLFSCKMANGLVFVVVEWSIRLLQSVGTTLILVIK